jgi:hypothetical protein
MKKSIIILVFFIASCSNSNQWYSLNSTDKSFEIEFPKKPIHRVDTSNSIYGKLPINIYLYQETKKNTPNLAFILAKTVYPDSIANRFPDNLDPILDSMVQSSINSDMKLISRKEIRLDSIKGREIKLDYLNGETIMTMKFYLHRNTCYVLSIITDPKKDFNINQKRFFESFKIIE